MITVRTVIRSATTSLRRIMSALRARRQQVSDRRLLSLISERELRELGLSRNQGIDSYYHRH